MSLATIRDIGCCERNWLLWERLPPGEQYARDKQRRHIWRQGQSTQTSRSHLLYQHWERHKQHGSGNWCPFLKIKLDDKRRSLKLQIWPRLLILDHLLSKPLSEFIFQKLRVCVNLSIKILIWLLSVVCVFCLLAMAKILIWILNINMDCMRIVLQYCSYLHRLLNLASMLLLHDFWLMFLAYFLVGKPSCLVAMTQRGSGYAWRTNLWTRGKNLI